MNKLCGSCQDIFRGRWVPRPESSSRLDSEDIGNAHGASMESRSSSPGLPFDFELDANALEPEDEADKEGDNGPDWIRLIDESNAGASARHELPKHHSIFGLEISAQQGCHLCTMIWDKIPHKYTGHANADPRLWLLLEQRSPRLIGVVAVRPYAGYGCKPQYLGLEVTYYLDGASDQPESYLFTIDLDLWLDEGKFPCSFSILIDDIHGVRFTSPQPSHYGLFDQVAAFYHLENS